MSPSVIIHFSGRFEPNGMDLVKKQFAVLGANGYLGRHMAAYLQSAGHSVTAYDLPSVASPDGICRRPLDVTNTVAFESVDTNVDALFMFAGLTGTHQGFDEYARYLAVNELGLLHLLDLLRRRGHRPRIVFPSSRLVYRGRPEPLSEDAPKESKTVYAANKLAAESYLQAYHAAFAIPYTVFRICVPYGNRWKGPYSYGTIGAFIRMARDQGTITLYGDGSLRRTFSHVQDICAQIEACVHRPTTNAQTYNVAGEPGSLRQVAGWIAERFGASVRQAPWPERELAIESGDTVFDDSKIRPHLSAPLRFTLRQWIDTADFSD